MGARGGGHFFRAKSGVEWGGGALRQTDVLSRGGMTTPNSLHVIGKAPVVYRNTQKLCAVDPVTQFI